MRKMKFFWLFLALFFKLFPKFFVIKKIIVGKNTEEKKLLKIIQEMFGKCTGIAGSVSVPQCLTRKMTSLCESLDTIVL